jgi:hypothetical protein
MKGNSGKHYLLKRGSAPPVREFQMTSIIQGRYEATIRSNSGSLMVIVTRDGDCLHGIPSRFYATEKAALTGARKILAKAAA